MLSSTSLDQNSLRHQHLFAVAASQQKVFVSSPSQLLPCAAPGVLPGFLLYGSANVFQRVGRSWEVLRHWELELCQLSSDICSS